MMPGTLQVRWEPGSDTLLGTCYCGERHTAEDPVEAWAWLLGHSGDHDGDHDKEGSRR